MGGWSIAKITSRCLTTTCWPCSLILLTPPPSCPFPFNLSPGWGSHLHITYFFLGKNVLQKDFQLAGRRAKPGKAKLVHLTVLSETKYLGCQTYKNCSLQKEHRTTGMVPTWATMPECFLPCMERARLDEVSDPHTYLRNGSQSNSELVWCQTETARQK